MKAPVVPAPVAPVVAAKPVIRSAPKPPPREIVQPVAVDTAPAKPVEAKLAAKPAGEKPSIKPVEAKPGFKPREKKPQKQPFQTRLWMNIGEEMGIVPNDIVNTISGETGLPGNIVGTVDIRGRHLFVDVVAEHANGIIAKLNRTRIKGHKIKVKAA